MAQIIDQIKNRFKQKDLLIQLIIINVAVFFALAVFSLITTLFKLESFSLIRYLGISSNVFALLYKPWTIFTYMFVHESFWHILFNMLMFYFFGQMFLGYFTPRNLGSLYILGGLAGAALYLAAFNTIPYYIDMGSPIMIGASASVMAVIFAVSFYRPNHEVMFLLIGRIKIVYIAVFIFLLDFISLGSTSNPGGHVAHIGGAILGFIFAKQYLKGKDITAWISKIMDSFVNIFKSDPNKKAKMKVKYQKRDADYEYNQHKQNNTIVIDSILDKIKTSGYTSLTSDEKKQLFDASKK